MMAVPIDATGLDRVLGDPFVWFLAFMILGLLLMARGVYKAQKWMDQQTDPPVADALREQRKLGRYQGRKT